MRIKTSKQWYTLFWVVWPSLTAMVFYLNGLAAKSFGIAAVILLICGNFLQCARQQKRWDREDADEKERKAKIDAYAAKMDEAMRWKFSGTRHADVWDDGDKFNPTIYAEYVAGETKYLVRSYTLWGSMTVYQLKGQGIVVQPLGFEKQEQNDGGNAG